MKFTYLSVITDPTCFQQQIQQYVGMVMLNLSLLTEQTNQSYHGSDLTLATVGCTIENKNTNSVYRVFLNLWRALLIYNLSPHEQCW